MRNRIGEILFSVLLFMLVVATDLCVQLFKAIPPPKSPVTPGCTITTSAASTAVAIVPLCKMGACVSYVDQGGNESGCVTY